MNLERQLLRICVLVGGCVPVSAGLAGAVFGARLTEDTLTASGDSHFRYLSGLLLAIGILFWSTVPRIEVMSARFRMLTFVVVVGGIVRVLTLHSGHFPHPAMLAAAFMEVIVTPALCLWQSRFANQAVGPPVAGAGEVP